MLQHCWVLLEDVVLPCAVVEFEKVDQPTGDENERREGPKMMGLGKGAPGFKYGHFWYRNVWFLGGISVDMLDKTLNYELEITRSIHGNGIFTDIYH